LHRLIENEEVSVYCDANTDISHVAPRGTESDANYLATSFPHGWARRNKQGHTKGAGFLLDEHKKNPYPTFYERRGDERREKSARAWLRRKFCQGFKEIKVRN
jgi:hypothetical protein